MITFRQLGEPLPDYLENDIHWQVEYWNDKEQGCPAGVAWCIVSGPFRLIEYILVRDEERRSGVATRLVEACRERWPNIKLTDAISKEGEALLEHLNVLRDDHG